MPFTHEYLTNYAFTQASQSYSTQDTILYALGLGVGSNPIDLRQLRYCFEQGLQSLPTMSLVLGHPGFWAGNPDLGIDWVKMLHVGQGLSLYEKLPAEGRVTTRARIADVVDRGAEKGALLYYERDVHDAASDRLIATVRQTLLCRGNGGFGGPARLAATGSKIPDRRPDHVVRAEVLPQAALIYRLSGDLNPLHVDPAVAAQAGFPRPILHGLATFGIASLALFAESVGYDADQLRSIDARFTAPVFPGDTIETEIWHLGDEVIFRTKIPSRNTLALDNGLARFEA